MSRYQTVEMSDWRASTFQVCSNMTVDFINGRLEGHHGNARQDALDPFRKAG